MKVDPHSPAPGRRGFGKHVFILTGCSKSAPPANSQNPTPAAQQPAAANNPPAPPAGQHCTRGRSGTTFFAAGTAGSPTARGPRDDPGRHADSGAPG